MVVYHFHGQTGRFMVWVNGSQSSGLVKLYKSVPFTGKRPRRPETGIKDCFKEVDHEFPIGIFHPEKKNRTTFSDVQLLPEIFRREDLKSCVPYALLTYGNMPVQPRLRVKILLKFKYENIVWLAFQKNLYSKTRLDGHITIREKSVFTFQPDFPKNCCKW